MFGSIRALEVQMKQMSESMDSLTRHIDTMARDNRAEMEQKYVSKLDFEKQVSMERILLKDGLQECSKIYTQQMNDKINGLTKRWKNVMSMMSVVVVTVSTSITWFYDKIAYGTPGEIL